MAKYIDNKEFNTRLKEYLILCDECEAEGKEIPQITHYIADSFIKIANGLGSTYRFSKYTYLEDMISDAISACVIKIRNFDYNKYENPFAYFTQICWFQFIGYIGDEYDQKKIIYRTCEALSLEEFNLDSEDNDTNNQYLEFLRENVEKRELDKLRETANEKKFVHRMLGKQKAKPKLVVNPQPINTLSFDD